MDKVTLFPNTAIIEEEASRWIVKFEGDEKPTEKDIQALNIWLKQSPVHRKILLEIAQNWNGMDILSGLMIPLGQSMKPAQGKFDSWLLAPLLMLLRVVRYLVKPLLVFSRPWVAMPALAFIIVLGLSYKVLNNPNELSNNLYITSVGQYSTHTLEDGSVLWLNSNSQVEVLFTHNKRLINLVEGEAHFNVESDPDRPFEVYAGNRMVKAVGTAFSVYRLADKIEVIVTEGKVDLAVVESTLIISPDDTPQSSITNIKQQSDKNVHSTRVLTSLEAGQSIAIPVATAQLKIPVVEHEPGDLARKLSWLEGRLVFAGESLEEVVAEVSRHTPIVIEVSDPSLKKLRIGGQFKAGETDALFDVLESGFGIKINRLSDIHVQLNAK